jgi:hypothetical protein
MYDLCCKSCGMLVYMQSWRSVYSTNRKWSFSGIISNKGLMMDPKKIQVVMDWLTPKTIRDVQCFFRFANFYRILLRTILK